MYLNNFNNKGEGSVTASEDIFFGSYWLISSILDVKTSLGLELVFGYFLDAICCNVK